MKRKPPGLDQHRFNFKISPRGVHVRNILAILLLVAFGWLSSAAQSVPSATEARHPLWAGAEASYFNPDYVCTSSFALSCSNDMLGIGAVADYGLRGRISAAGEARWLEWGGANGVSESSYLIGPQYRLWNRGSMSLQGNVLLGAGRFSNPRVVGSYFVYAPGIQFEKRASTRFKWFVSYQYQIWPAWSAGATVNSSGQIVSHNNGITPNGFDVGLKYQVF